MRAIEPVEAGRLTLDGFTISYEVFGDRRAPAVLLLPAWQIVHSRLWKLQVPFLARALQVVTYDPPGNGGGERTTDPAAFEFERVARQGIGLLDNLGIDQTDVLGLSRGCAYGLLIAARWPERVKRLVLIGNSVANDGWHAAGGLDPLMRRESYQGWEKLNVHFMREHYGDFFRFYFEQLCPEPHSTKPIDDGIGWGLETSPEILASTLLTPALLPSLPSHQAISRVKCPILLIHGDMDRRVDIQRSRSLAAARPDWALVTLEGSGHLPILRDPVRVNRLIEDFLSIGPHRVETASAGGPVRRSNTDTAGDRAPDPAPPAAARSWRRAAARDRRRALFISSPIGLGHVQRDLAVARALRRHVPDLQIDWLAQPPVSDVLLRSGEHVHPMSQCLSSESAHWESWAGIHRLHAFYAYRDMDEILLANFMVFLDLVREVPYDLWVGDEAWEVDYFLHENPELKTAPFVFMTDFLGWLPIDQSAGSREAFLTADYNAEMIAQVARYPRVRDRAIYIGDYDDLIPERFGPNLPLIPDWTREHFEAVGYVVPFDPADLADTCALRRRLGYEPDSPLIIAAAGGTAVGKDLLRKVADTWPLIRQARPDARCVIVAGPRVAPAGITAEPGLELRNYVHNLYEHLAAADLGIVQGGLGTTMELAITRRPFLYFPLQDHCEQHYHVAYRLDRHRVGRRLDFDSTSPEALADVVLATLASDTSGYRPYTPGGAERAADLIATLL